LGVKSSQRPGPFPGEHWGSYEIIEELPPLKIRGAPYKIATERIFTVRCICGCPSLMKRRRLIEIDERPGLGCPACRGASSGSGPRTTFPERWPDGIYGTWRLLERVVHKGQWKWRMNCRGCGTERYEAKLRVREKYQECRVCALRARREKRIRERAAARGSTILRLELT
jgi:hypothetical protein